MELGEDNVQVMKRYVELANEHYREPVIELLDDLITSVLEALVSDESESDMKVGKQLFSQLLEGC